LSSNSIVDHFEAVGISIVTALVPLSSMTFSGHRQIRSVVVVCSVSAACVQTGTQLTRANRQMALKPERNNVSLMAEWQADWPKRRDRKIERDNECPC
jgi:hypothetical protein